MSGGIRVEIRARVRVGPALRVQRRIAAEVEAEIPGEVDEVGAGVDPVLEVRD